mmetsp:Transcript_10579/g.19312  ORF Transcript_10579/g.19312 Transcript_10579/m.19312 type:complete len:358 (-) Transcript_10579:261-1334(-)|eukprot:CAMPEP_0197523340 /NCGR_PEP_ID=MMETSP1318-20131121/8298_1 /TAXON_ID=552666 /ORGANISM="Partenskyella glossopodia, Strain RCC365" /LENGTH=357 /DNA_ID=CAMNT_0043076007 /DNA_START=322 /DNA_END=1395 /DNA_ORIENTATION=+
MVSKIRLVISPNKKRHVKRPVVFELNSGEQAPAMLNSLMKLASKKLCFKAKALYTTDGVPLSEENLRKYINSSSDGVGILVTKKKDEIVPKSPTTSPSIKPTPIPPPILRRRRSSHQDNLIDSLAPLFENSLGGSVLKIISDYATNVPVFDTSSLPASVCVVPGSRGASVKRVALTRKHWKEKGSKKFTVLGYGIVQGCIHQVMFRVDHREADKDHDHAGGKAGYHQGRVAIGVVDSKHFKGKVASNYGIGDCSHSWGLGCDGMFRHRGKVIKLQDGQGRTPSWKTGDVVGMSINPVTGKLAFFVGRKQYRVNPRTIHLPSALKFGISFASVGDQFTFLDWTEQDTMQFSMPKELKL